MPNDLRVGIVADASQMEATFDAAGASVDAFTQKTNVSAARYVELAKTSKEANQQLSASFNAAREAGVGAAGAMDIAVAEYEKLTAVAAESAAVQGRVATSMRGTGGATNILSNEMRVLEGSTMGAARSAGMFLDQTIGLGPVLSAAFPVFGAAALGMVIFDVGKMLVKFGEDAEEIGQELGVGWLDGAILQLEGFGEKIKEAEKNMEGYRKEQDASIAKSKEFSFKATDESQGKSAGDTERIMNLKLSADGLKTYVGLLQQRYVLEDKMANLSELAKTPEKYPTLPEFEQAQALGIDIHKPEMAAEQARETKSLIDSSNAQLTEMQMHMTDLASQAAKAGGPNKETGKVPHEDYADELAAQELAHGRSLGATVLYWESVVEKTGKYHERLLRAEEEFQKQINEPGKIKKELEKQGPKGEAPDAFIKIPAEKLSEAEINERITREMDSQAKAAERTYAATMKTIEHQEKMGLGRRSDIQKGATAERAASEKEYQDTTAPIDAQMKAMAPMGSGALDTKQLDEYNKLLEKKKEAAQKNADQIAAITQKEAEKEKQAYDKMFSGLTGPMNTFVDHWMTSGKRMGAAFRDMADHMAMNMINAELKMLEKHLAMEIEKKVITETSNAATAASTVASNAIKSTSDTTTAMKSIEKKAADAAAGAWNAMSNIPVVGPILGAIAAAVTYAGIMSLAAFEKGTDYVPRTGLAMLHEGERVSTRPENEAISKALSSGKSGQNAENHFHYSPNISGIDGASVAGMARQHGNTFMRQAGRQMRLMGREQG